MTPAARSSGRILSSLVSAPRTLKALVGCTVSTFRWTWQPALVVKAREYCSGEGLR